MAVELCPYLLLKYCEKRTSVLYSVLATFAYCTYVCMHFTDGVDSFSAVLILWFAACKM